MSEEKVQLDDQGRDYLDGGFAVVDREKIIEEETRVITPWYKHFINVFAAPRKMMEENFYQDPPKGVSIGIVGSVLFTIIMTLLTFQNPITKQQALDGMRMNGIAEEMLGQGYVMAQVTGTIAAVVLIFIGSFFTALVIQIVKAIIKDKGRFGSLFTVVLLSQMVAAALLCIDRLIAMMIPTASTSVLGLPILLSEDIMLTNMVLGVLAQVATIPSILSICILVIGYSVVTRTSTKKSIAVIAGVEAVFILISLGFAYAGQMFMQNMQSGL